MALLDRYLNAVRNHLPAAQQDDIVAELADDLRARFDERAAELGRPLTEADEAELLKPFGRPLLLAARYRPRHYLIGPNLFPYYWATLKFALGVAVIVFAAVTITLAVAGRPLEQVFDVLGQGTFNALLSVFTWVTLVFALVDVAAAQAKKWDEWDPRSLPRGTQPASPRSRVEVALDLVFSAAFATVWAATPHSEWLRTLANSPLELGPAWATFYVPVLVVVIASMAAKAVTLVRPDLATFRFVASLVTTVAGVGILMLLLGAGDLLVPAGPDARAEALVRVANQGLRVSFVVAIVINVITTALDARRYLQGRHARFS
ncbi:MAG: hypothetical protein H6Q08_1606 [Acidobacteria bacterium]|jgi:hypothetical protein|nr:hypothetical protein [Acidobacteriota bacterium]